MSDTLTYEIDHDLPLEEWETVVAEAERTLADRIATDPELGGAGDYAPMGLTPRVVRYDNVPDKSSTLLRRQLHVVHTGETPLKVGYAQSLTAWGSGGYDPRASWHFFVDPATVAFWISITQAAWHAAGGNPLSCGYEQSGYASYTREKWLSPDGQRQLDLLAQTIVEHGKLPASGLRWLTDTQVKAILTGADTTTVGLCTHEQVSRLTGRTTRTDPGREYPKDVLLDFVRYYHPATKITVKPAPVVTTLPKGALLSEDGIADAGTVKAFARMWGVKNPTGRWDAITVAAAQRWAKVDEHGRALTVDGELGPKTRGAIQRKISAPIEPWSYGWTTKPTRTTRYLEAYYNRAVRNRGRGF